MNTATRPSCAYESHNEPDAAPNAVRCMGAIAATVHDGRECVHVCIAHAIWRLTKCSMSPGHGTDCAVRP